jgi:hypothetical protein
VFVKSPTDVDDSRFVSLMDSGLNSTGERAHSGEMCSYAVARSTDELNGCASEDRLGSVRTPLPTEENHMRKSPAVVKTIGYPKLAPYIRIGGVTLKATPGYTKVAK